MAFFDWKDEYRVGVPELDAQHRHLIGMVNQLHEAMLARSTGSVLNNILRRLIRYTNTHFGQEERLMEASGYPGLSEHRRKHEQMRKRVISLQDDLECGRVLMGTEVLELLVMWVDKHIRETDLAYSPWIQTHLNA